MVETASAQMDTEFNHLLMEMKPFVLRLPRQTEKQRCALWMKKLSEPQNTADDCKNRDLYAKLLLHMLKRGIMDGPFVFKPERGRLKMLPSYMSVFFENPSAPDSTHLDEKFRSKSPGMTFANLPSWVLAELDETTFTTVPANENPDLNSEIHSFDPPALYLSKSDGSLDITRNGWNSNNDGQCNSKPKITPISSVVHDESSFIQLHNKDRNSKVLCAQFHEARLKLQRKHDKAVQKILTRKNSEIEELKQYFRHVEKECDEKVAKVEKRSQSLVEELRLERNTKEKEIDHLKKVIDENSETAKADFGAKVQEVTHGFERDKYELQKLHTKKIKDLLDDTNQRLLKMEEEYNSQTVGTKLMIQEMEARISQLTRETESLSAAKRTLSNEKEHAERALQNVEKKLNEVENSHQKLQTEHKMRIEEHKLQLEALHTKHGANTDFLKQENNLFINKAQGTARELEDQIRSLKHALQDCEQQRLTELRERDSLHQQDLASMQRLHEKQLHQLQNEWDQDKLHGAKLIRGMENSTQEKDNQIMKLSAQLKQSAEEAQNAIEQYKMEMLDAEKKGCGDMQLKLDKMETLYEECTRQKEAVKQEMESEVIKLKAKHHDNLNIIRMKHEQNEETLTQQAAAEREQLSKAHSQQLADVEQRMQSCLGEQERITNERVQQHRETVTAMEVQMQELREELISVNALRRQQLVELGLLREEERQKAAREHESLVSQLEAEIGRQKLVMRQQNATSLDEKEREAKVYVEAVKKDYQQRLELAYDRISELQQKESSIKEELQRLQSQYEQQIADNEVENQENAKKLQSKIKGTNITLAAELESEREKLHSIKRQLQKVEFDLKDEVVRVKMEYEEKLRGMLPASLKQDMEDTITCLRSQVSSLQQRVSVLQQVVNENQRLSTPASYEMLDFLPEQLS